MKKPMRIGKISLRMRGDGIVIRCRDKSYTANSDPLVIKWDAVMQNPDILRIELGAPLEDCEGVVALVKNGSIADAIRNAE